MHLKHPKLDDVLLSGTHVTILVFDHLSLLIKDLCFATLSFHEIVYVLHPEMNVIFLVICHVSTLVASRKQPTSGIFLLVIISNAQERNHQT